MTTTGARIRLQMEKRVSDEKKNFEVDVYYQYFFLLEFNSSKINKLYTHILYYHS